MIRWQALLGMYGATRCIASWPAEARSAMDGKPSPAGYSSCVHTTDGPRSRSVNEERDTATQTHTARTQPQQLNATHQGRRVEHRAEGDIGSR